MQVDAPSYITSVIPILSFIFFTRGATPCPSVRTKDSGAFTKCRLILVSMLRTLKVLRMLQIIGEHPYYVCRYQML